MSDRERPPIDFFVDRLPQDMEKAGYTLAKHVRTALAHNLGLVHSRLDGVAKVFDELYALASHLAKQDPAIAQQMRAAISFGRDCELKAALWLIDAFIHGIDPYATRGVDNLVDTRRGSKIAQATVQEERDPVKHRWREHAEKRWSKNPSLSIKRVADLILAACEKAHGSNTANDIQHVCARNPRTNHAFSARTIRDTIADLKPPKQG